MLIFSTSAWMFCAVATSVAAAPAAPGSAAQAGAALALTVSGPENVNDVANLKVTTTLHNTGSETLRLLNDPKSVLAPEWETDVFDVVHQASGAVPSFHGVKVRDGVFEITLQAVYLVTFS